MTIAKYKSGDLKVSINGVEINMDGAPDPSRELKPGDTVDVEAIATLTDGTERGVMVGGTVVSTQGEMITVSIPFTSGKVEEVEVPRSEVWPRRGALQFNLEEPGQP